LYGSIAEYEHLIAGIATPSQIEDTQRLKEAADFKVDELRDVVTLYQSGDQDGALDLFRSGKGVRAMNGIRDIVVLLEAEEEKLLESTRQSGTAAREQMEITLAVLALLSLSGFGLAYLNHVRSDRLTVVEEHAVELAEAREQADLLARELNHRVKNLFAMVLAIVQMSARDASDVGAYRDHIASRIRALLTAHEVTQGHGTAADRLARQDGASVEALVKATVEPHVSDAKRIALEGADVTIDRIQVTPLGLVLHELATNAVKYGCWQDEGLLTVRWQQKGDLLHLEWQESRDSALAPEGAEDAPQSGSQGGFGSTLMIGAARQLGGEIERTFGPRGVTVSIAFPAHPTSGAA